MLQQPASRDSQQTSPVVGGSVVPAERISLLPSDWCGRALWEYLSTRAERGQLHTVQLRAFDGLGKNERNSGIAAKKTWPHRRGVARYI